MDTQTGRFQEMTDDEAAKRNAAEPGRFVLFEIGKVVEIEGHKFRVRKVTRKDLILRAVAR